MTTPELYREIWEKGKYRLGSTAQRLVPFLKAIIPAGATINDYGAGTGRADVLLAEAGYKLNLVDFADNALEDDARALIGPGFTYHVAPLESLPADFPHAEWGICINVLMVVDPAKLDAIMVEMRRTCDNLIIETYDWPDVRLGENRTLIQEDGKWWAEQARKYWHNVLAVASPEHRRRYITICRS